MSNQGYSIFGAWFDEGRDEIEVPDEVERWQCACGDWVTERHWKTNADGTVRHDPEGEDVESTAPPINECEVPACPR